MRSSNTASVPNLTNLTPFLRPPHSHHQGLVHEELSSWSAVVVLGVYSEAEEQDVHDHFQDWQEAVSHQEGDHTHQHQGCHPLQHWPLLVPLVQQQHACQRRGGHHQDLKGRRSEVTYITLEDKISGNLQVKMLIWGENWVFTHIRKTQGILGYKSVWSVLVVHTFNQSNKSTFEGSFNFHWTEALFTCGYL